MIFHIYKKNTETTEVVEHSLSVEEMERMIADRRVDWVNWEIQPCTMEYEHQDASF